MSQENAEIVRRGYEAFNRGDMEAMVADVAPSLRVTDSSRMMDSTTSRWFCRRL
jgi:ketosteroid isomerase-like protein